MVLVRRAYLLLAGYLFLFGLLLMASGLLQAVVEQNTNHALNFSGQIAMLLFGLIFAIELYLLSHQKNLRPAIALGLFFGLAYILLKLLYQWQCNGLESSFSFQYQQLCSASDFHSGRTLIEIVTISGVYLLAAVVYTSIGRHYSHAAGVEPLPVLEKKELPGNWRYFSAIGLHLISAIAITTFFFTILLPNFRITSLSEVSSTLQNPQLSFLLINGWIAALWEEVVFRLGIQSYLLYRLRNKSYGWIIAVGLTSLIWAAMHATSVEGAGEALIRIAQLLPQGFTLGYLTRRYGLESSILAHGFFNTLIIIILLPQ